MVDAVTSGFAAIAPKAPTGPLARRKLVKQPDGTTTVVFIDNNTGQELTSLDGYSVIESGNYLDLDTLGLDPLSGEEEETTAEKTIKDVRPKSPSDSGGADRDPETARGGPQGGPRDPSNNFGYFDKPGIVGLAGALPGALGMAGKAVNAGINANNMMAADAARGMMGVPDQSFGQKVKSVMKDNKGQVANVNLNNQQYAVGLEALSPTGQTNLTPNEARVRGLTLPGGINLSTPAEVKANEAAFADEFGKKQGIFSGVVSAATSFIDDVFGNQEEQRYAQEDSPFSPTPSGFADMLGYDPNSTGYGNPATSRSPAVSGNSGSSGSSKSGGLRSGVNNARGGSDGRGSGTGGGSGGYDSVGTPSNNDSSFGGPR